MNDTNSPISKAMPDPAADAAAMLLRLGFAIFALVIPSATLMSRWVIVVLVPIGAVLVILSTVLKGDPFRIIGSLFASLRTIHGLTAFLLAIWVLVSIAWAPNPQLAGEKVFKGLGVILLALLAIKALPYKMRASNLHLVTIGVALGALLILAAGANELYAFTNLRFPSATPGRASVLLSCLGWAAAAWLLIKNRRGLAVVLMGLVFVSALVGPTTDAVLPIGIGFLVFALAWAVPERAGNVLGAISAGLIVFAPVLALLARTLGQSLGQAPGALLNRLGLWWDITAADPLHVLTGRGFDAAAYARDLRFIPPEAPVTLLSDLWFDLGLLGALGFGLIVFSLFRAVGRFGLEVAPLALAGLGAAFVYALVERGATQTWWLNGMTVFAIVLLSVERGRYRTVRPRASVKRRAETMASITMEKPG